MINIKEAFKEIMIGHTEQEIDDEIANYYKTAELAATQFIYEFTEKYLADLRESYKALFMAIDNLEDEYKKLKVLFDPADYAEEEVYNILNTFSDGKGDWVALKGIAK